MSKDNGKINTIYWFYAGHIDWKNSIAVCASMDLWKRFWKIWALR